jgi:hypothetical protein
MPDKGALKAEAGNILKNQGKVAAALHLATALFEGVTDKAGKPYIGHLLRVRDGLRGLFQEAAADRRESLQVIALLHDVIEDISGWTYEDLADIGFDAFEIDGIRAVTKQSEGEPYFDAMVRVGLTPQAIPSKRSDLRDNSDISRFSRLPRAADFERLTKYFLADKYLESIEAGKTAPGTPFGAWMAAQPDAMQDWHLFEKYSSEPNPKQAAAFSGLRPGDYSPW